MAGTGLQPANLVLVILPFVLSFSIVVIRVWRRIKEDKFAIGKGSITVLQIQDILTRDDRRGLAFSGCRGNLARAYMHDVQMCVNIVI